MGKSNAQGVFSSGPRLAFPPRSILAARLGLLLAGRQVDQQAVEGGRGEPRQLAEGFRGSLQTLGVGHVGRFPTRGPIVQRLYVLAEFTTATSRLDSPRGASEP